MYHPEIIARRQRRLEQTHGSHLPNGRLARVPLDQAMALKRQLDDAVDEDLRPIRSLTKTEQDFVLCESLLMTIDYLHWSSRWAMIAKETQDTEPISPRWESQKLFLKRIGDLEYERVTSGHPDGLLINVLKARQLGISTEIEVMLAHRIVSQTGVRGLVAADVKEQSQYLMSMAELVIANLPWWLRVPVKAHQVGNLWLSGNGSSLRSAWGKSSRGGMKDDEKTKGNIGRGKTFGVSHISEVSTWERPRQLNDALLPGLPRRSRTLSVWESTAKGRYDYWHDHWLMAERHVGRFTNVFIPWYIEPDKYWAPPPEGWAPSDSSKQHADLVERTSPRWLGHLHRLSKEQLFWYESTRQSFEESAELAKFLEEYCAVPEEAFQYAGRTIFTVQQLEAMRTQERAPVLIVHVQPAKDIAQLRAWEREQEKLKPETEPA